MGCKDIGIRKLEFGAKTQFPLQEQEKVETDFNLESYQNLAKNILGPLKLICAEIWLDYSKSFTIDR